MNEKETLEFIKNNPGKAFKISCISNDKARSYRQIKYYFGVVIKIIRNFHGYNEIETNEILKLMFKKETFTDLSTKEFENIMSIIRQLWMQKFGVNIPKPNEEYYIINNL